MAWALEVVPGRIAIVPVGARVVVLMGCGIPSMSAYRTASSSTTTLMAASRLMTMSLFHESE
jgi:hypothetical protein